MSQFAVPRSPPATEPELIPSVVLFRSRSRDLPVRNIDSGLKSGLKQLLDRIDDLDVDLWETEQSDPRGGLEKQGGALAGTFYRKDGSPRLEGATRTSLSSLS
jgi:hypothetical protein